MDTPNGAIFGLAKAAAKDFDPSFSAVQPYVVGETYDYFYGVGLAQTQ